MSSEILDIELRLKIDRMVAELEKIPGVATKEARKMAMAWSRDYARAEKSAEKMAREAERQADRVREAWKGSAERTASLMGGVFGDISDSVLELGSGFGELADDIGGTQGAIVGLTGITAGLAAAAGFAAHAFLEWMGTTKELREELKRVQGTPPLSDEHKQALDRYVMVAERADAASLALSVQLRAQLAPAASEMELAFVGLSSALSSVSESRVASALWRVHEVLQALNAPQQAVNAAWDYFVGAGEDVIKTVSVLTEKQAEMNRVVREGGDEIRVTNEELNKYAEALGYVRETYVDLDEEERKRQEASKAAAKAALEAAKAEQKAWDDTVASLTASLDARVAYEAQLQAEAAAAQAASDAQRKQLVVAGEAWAAMSAEATAYAQVLDEQVRQGQLDALSEITDATLAFVDGAAQNKIDALTNEEQAARKVHQRELARLETEREAIQQKLEDGKISEEQAKARLDEIDEEAKQRRKTRREERKAAKDALLDAFAAQKAAARVRAIIDAAANAVALTAAFAYLGPGAPAAALGVAGAQLAVQLGVIRNQKPPSFAAGGMVRDRIQGDHAVIAADPNEGILTPRGVSNAGGPAGVDALNRGTVRAASGGATAVYLDGRMLGEVVARVIETDRQVGAALDRRIGMVAGVAR